MILTHNPTPAPTTTSPQTESASRRAPARREPAVLPPESPLHMDKQQLLPTPKVLQRGFWRECAVRTTYTLAWPARFTRAVYTFCTAREHDGVIE